MIYLGKDTKDQPLMFGASHGQTYRHQKMSGFSVFDFRISNRRGGDFVDYKGEVNSQLLVRVGV